MNLLSLFPFAVMSEATLSSGSSLSSQLANAIDCGDLGSVECLLDERTYVSHRFSTMAYERGYRNITLAIHRHMLVQDMHAPIRIV